MADKAKGYGSVKRFGVRYGTKLKGKIGKIEAERRLSTKCPYCSYDKAKRIASGIWNCEKCKAKFTGRAYTIGGKVAVKEATEEAQAGPEEVQEEKYQHQPEEEEDTDEGDSEDEEQDNEREA